MMCELQWQGSSLLPDKTGTASFTVGGMCYVLRLDTFADAQKIAGLIDESFRCGKVVGARTVFLNAKESALFIGADV